VILLTVGTQLPFDRLVAAVDAWAIHSKINEEIIAQIGHSTYTPKKLRHLDFLTPVQVEKFYKEATAIVAHAGTGSIISALEHGKPVVVMPRDHRLGEHRNGHQFSTAERFKDVEGVRVAYNETDMFEELTALTRNLDPIERISTRAPTQFINRLKQYFRQT
jgi:UDP-N-acetylglucosamine transferase subunit ALG13